MSFHSVPGSDPIDTLNILKDSVLVLPTISIGNTPQLAVDLLIYNLNLKLVGRLDDTYLYPFVSPVDCAIDANIDSNNFIQEKENQENGILSSLELYYGEDLKISVLQQRSPILPGYQNMFLTELILPFIHNVGFSKVIILNSEDFGLQLNNEKKFQIYYDDDNLNDFFKKLSIDDEEIENDFTKNNNINNFNIIKEVNEKNHSKFINGFVKIVSNNKDLSLQKFKPTQIEKEATTAANNLTKFLSANSTNAPEDTTIETKNTNNYSINLIILSIFVYEGDNSHDAKLLDLKFFKIFKLLNTSNPKILQFLENINLNKIPKSWLGVYGNKPLPVGYEDGLYA
ncbi:hypothetical protein PACTADRAFT_51146 [Pachysolen tannophilus NRRL Y-2460]|uniref:Proteasome assembly chaperone 2 n=1 Tax=Pachysolen tannophilus NRRL Y-2460 TaxID=669874 RepID=A0A1E4TR90_PACTA|nr:hypothetical protein PACTADRAFT_51146 [Pachysolen tannophilus NRRL Y-2460]